MHQPTDMQVSLPAEQVQILSDTAVLHLQSRTRWVDPLNIAHSQQVHMRRAAGGSTRCALSLT